MDVNTLLKGSLMPDIKIVANIFSDLSETKCQVSPESIEKYPFLLSDRTNAENNASAFMSNKPTTASAHIYNQYWAVTYFPSVYYELN